MENKPHIAYKLLDLSQFTKFVSVYKDSFREVEGFEPKEIYMANWMKFVIEGMNDPNFLFLCAQRGKKIVGIILIAPMPNFSQEKQALIEPMYVIPEYRKHPFIATTLVELAKGWLIKKKCNTAFIFENLDTDKWERKTKLCNFKQWKKLLKWNLPKEEKKDEKTI